MRKFVARFAWSICVVLLAFSTLPAQQEKSSWVNGVTHDGESITCDLPNEEHIRNIGSKIDGSGMCVYSSIEMAARYQGLEEMRGWRDWCAAKYPGGGYPQKVEKLLEAWGKAKGIAVPPYMQYEGNDPGPLLELIDRTNRMASFTYGYSPRYGSYVPHMTNGIHYQRYGVVLDNNFIGDKQYEWMLAPELVRRTRLQPGMRVGSAWVFVWLTPGAPPPPKARKK